MRFCPFCSHENTVEAVSCAACGRRLPPLPQRRIQRAGGSQPISRPLDAAIATAQAAPPPPPAAAPVPPVPAPPPAAAIPAGPVTLPAAAAVPAPIAPDAQRALRTSLLPPPAALRRLPPLVEDRPVGADARRATDVSPSPPAFPEPSPDPSPDPIPNPSPDPIPSSTLLPIPELAGDIRPTSSPTLVTPPPTLEAPPPTRIARGPELAGRPFSPPQVVPLPQAPEPGLVNYARYSIAFARARWQRRRAVKQLQGEIKGDTDALDVVLGTLGREARSAGVDNRALASENQAITAAEHKKAETGAQVAELGQRRAEEVTRFEELERERTVKLTEVERARDEAERALDVLEGQRRALRDKRKDLERRQKAYLQAAEQRDEEAGNAPLGDTRSELRRISEGHRGEAAGLEPEKQEYERKLATLERPLASAQSAVAAIRAEVDLARRSLADAREGHRHRLAELDAELGRKHRDQEHTDGEIQRRLVTLGTLINLHRVERVEFTELYQRVDRLRAAIGARTTEIDQLVAERDAYDRGALMRGYAVIGGVIVGIVTIIAILIAIL